jgi:thiol:disulfide interchange protein
MRLARTALILLLLCLNGMAARAAHTQAALILGADSIRPGSSILTGVRLHIDPDWHIYWRNPGASGMATRIDWQLPPGVTAGPIQWPLPAKLSEADFITYVYTDEVVLLVPLTFAPDVSPGSLKLQAKVSWLECEKVCVPGDTAVQATLSIGPETRMSANAALLESWQKRLPQDGSSLAAKAHWEQAAAGDSRPLVLEWNSSVPAANADFFPNASDDFEVQGAVESLSAGPGKAALRKQVKKFSANWPARISGVLILETGSGRQGYEINLPLESESAKSASAEPPSTVPLPLPPALWKMLLYAFLGGLILNIMPCVLPVIALKILGFVGQAREEPARVRLLGMVYGLGVLASFASLALLVIGAKAAGHHAGWGMQFGSPEFLVVLTLLVTLVALNLFGVFEVNLGGRAANAAGSLASRHGASGAFFNGVLATALATPCTAPFLGAALGFAFAGTATTVLLIFLTAGAGLALPYVVLSWQPAWLKFLPKPGPWMQRFKVAMGFPMLATAVWLASLLPIFYGQRTLWLGVFLVLVALAAWIYGEFVQRALSRKWPGMAATLILLAAAYLFALEGQLDWRNPLAATEMQQASQKQDGGIAWQPWSPAAVTEARAAGRPVLVDFTADWCLTCQANKRLAIDTPAVQTRLKDIRATALLGDYTRFPANIADELTRYGRAGVPLVLVYSSKPNEPPQVLPELLTPGIVLNALEQAAR